MTEFRAPAVELARFRLRVVVAAVFVLVCFGLLAARFHHLQVKRHDYFLTRAEDNRIALLPVVPHRGTIVDRKGVVLAANYSAYTLEITPSKVAHVDRAIDELATVIEVSARDRRRFKRLQEESKNFESLPIRTRLTEQEVARFAVNRFRFPGFEIKARLFRSYPHGELPPPTPSATSAASTRRDVRAHRRGGATRPTTSGSRPHRQGSGSRAVLRARAARHHRQRAGGDRRGRPRDPRALARSERRRATTCEVTLDIEAAAGGRGGLR
jgi:penicillin-binding protein 2